MFQSQKISLKDLEENKKFIYIQSIGAPNFKDHSWVGLILPQKLHIRQVDKSIPNRVILHTEYDDYTFYLKVIQDEEYILLKRYFFSNTLKLSEKNFFKDLKNCLSDKWSSFNNETQSNILSKHIMDNQEVRKFLNNNIEKLI